MSSEDAAMQILKTMMLYSSAFLYSLFSLKLFMCVFKGTR